MNKQALIDVLEAESGYHEKMTGTPSTFLDAKRNDYDSTNPNDNYTKYHRDLGVAQGQDWCGFFAFWAVTRVLGSTSAATAWLHNIVGFGGATSSWAKAFQAVGKWHPRGDGYRPKAGDAVVYEDDGIPWSHIEFCTNADMYPFNIVCVGGNTSNGSGGSQSQGFWVYMRTRNPTATSGFRVKGYCECEFDDDPYIQDVDLLLAWWARSRRKKCWY